MCVPKIRIVVAGDLGTGKSSLINFYISSIFADFDSTLEDTYTKKVLVNNIIHDVEIVDTVDNEFRNNHDVIHRYQQCDAIILAYAIDDVKSFDSLFKRYSYLPIDDSEGDVKITIADGKIKAFPPVILAGLKQDLENSRQVAFQQGQNLSNKLQLQDFIECSTVNRSNVEELFNRAITLGLKYQQSEQDLTDLYFAEDKDSHSKPLELNKVVTANSVKSTLSGNNSNKALSRTEKFTPIEETDDKEAVETITVDSIPMATSSFSRSNKSLSKERRHLINKKHAEPSKGSNGCCTIM